MWGDLSGSELEPHRWVGGSLAMGSEPIHTTCAFPRGLIGSRAGAHGQEHLGAGFPLTFLCSGRHWY